MKKAGYLLVAITCLIFCAVLWSGFNAADEAPKIHKVIIKEMKFIPADITIHQGDKIVWINKGIVSHNVTAFPSQEWTSGKLNIGQKWEMKPEVNDISYYCSIHPTMKGCIMVIYK